MAGLGLTTFKRVCANDDCGLEAYFRKQLCYEDWLNKQPPVVRAEAAERRLSLIPESARRSTVPAKDWPPGRRFCAGCQTFIRLQDCSGSRCKACTSIANHAGRVKKVFGLDGDDYQFLLRVQGGRCAICRSKPKTVRFAVDHQHGHCATGCSKCVRGLLCSRCNRELLGAAHDSVHIIRNALTYLETPPAQGDWLAPQVERDEWERSNPGEPLAPF